MFRIIYAARAQGLELGPNGCAAALAVIGGAACQPKVVPRMQAAFFAIKSAGNDLFFFYFTAFAALVVV